METLLNLFWQDDSDSPDYDLLEYASDLDKFLHCVIIGDSWEIGFVSAMVKDESND